MRWYTLLGVICGLTLPPNLVQAWNKPGHMVTAAIAYQVLKKDSPEALAKIVALLREHPYFKTKWESQLAQPFVPVEQRDLYLFMWAARWADDARDDVKFYPADQHHDRWHYINLPYKPEGQPDSVQVAKPDLQANIFVGFEKNLHTLQKGTEASDRAVAATWLFHLVGDVHQPLHVVSFFSETFQKDGNGKLVGDRGGTRFYIRAKETSSIIHLHQFWDDLIIGSDRFLSVRNRATELMLRPDFAREKLPELKEKSFEKWATQESLPLAKDVAYLQGKLKGSDSRTEAFALPENYTKKAQAVAEKQAVLAGYRLAQVMQQAFEPAQAEKPAPK